MSRNVFLAALAIAAAAIVWLLISRMGTWPALGAWAVAMAIACAVAALLVRTAPP
jgi:hypothetical protein